MELYIQGFVTASINNIDLKTTLTRRELNDRQARGKTRAAIRRDVFFDTVRDALLSANFDKVDGDWDAAATERAKLDYIRRLAPFLLPDLAHTAAAFVVDRSFLKPTLGDACSSDEITAATAVLQTRESTYVEFPHETFLSSGEVGARMVIITTVDAQRFKWSAVLEPTGEFAETCVVSWYVTRGIAEPYTNCHLCGQGSCDRGLDQDLRRADAPGSCLFVVYFLFRPEFRVHLTATDRTEQRSFLPCD